MKTNSENKICDIIETLKRSQVKLEHQSQILKTSLQNLSTIKNKVDLIRLSI